MFTRNKIGGSVTTVRGGCAPPWAIATDRETAKQRALDACKATAGASRREYCAVDGDNCDVNN